MKTILITVAQAVILFITAFTILFTIAQLICFIAMNDWMVQDERQVCAFFFTIASFLFMLVGMKAIEKEANHKKYNQL